MEDNMFQKPTFKNFVNEMYYRNVEERFHWGEKSISFKKYVEGNKWYLKKIYVEEKQNGNA